MTKIINCYQAPMSRESKAKRLNLRFLNFGLATLVIVLGVFYMLTISDLTVKGFALKKLKTQVNYLASEKLDSEETINNLQSYYSLNSRTGKLNMVAIGEIDYLSIPPTLVARK